MNAAPPDVLVYPLDEARALLLAAGFAVDVSETHPPGRGLPQGLRRVVRQRQEGGGVRLIVTAERYERSAPPAAAGP